MIFTSLSIRLFWWNCRFQILQCRLWSFWSFWSLCIFYCWLRGWCSGDCHVIISLSGRFTGSGGGWSLGGSGSGSCSCGSRCGGGCWNSSSSARWSRWSWSIVWLKITLSSRFLNFFFPDFFSKTLKIKFTKNIERKTFFSNFLNDASAPY